jgi:hypothetical protein
MAAGRGAGGASPASSNHPALAGPALPLLIQRRGILSLTDVAVMAANFAPRLSRAC